MDEETDESEKRVVEVPVEFLESVLKLASESRDLVARSALRWDDEDPILSDLGSDFREKVIEDLAGRDDLPLSECVRVIKNLVDPYDLEDDDFVLDRGLSVALVKAGLCGGGLGTSWARKVSWDDVDPSDVRRLFDAATERCMTAALVGDEARRDIEFWVRHVAPHVEKNPVERLEWLAQRIAGRANDGYIGDTLEFVADLAWSWLAKIPQDDLRGEIRGLCAVASIARCGALDLWGETEGNLQEAWGGVRWGSVSRESLAVLLAEETPLAVAAAAKQMPREEALLPLVAAAAPIVHPELVDRLVWFAEVVGKPAGDAPVFREELNTALTEVVCKWLEELRRADVEDIVVVLRAFRRVPMAASIYQPDVDESLEALRDALRQSVDEETE